MDDLEDAGVPRSDAHAYAEGVRRGDSLAAVEYRGRGMRRRDQSGGEHP
jgi:hypothetical protein